MDGLLEPLDIASQTCEQLEAWMQRQNQRPFHGRQIFRWIHGKGAAGFEEMTDLPKDMRATLASAIALEAPKIVEEQRAEDGTAKFRYLLADGREVEGVFIPERDRRTLCVSTQVGCGLGCAFCATATMGLLRNLTAGEIVGQVEASIRRLRAPGLRRPVTNVVFMGMGEPLANLDSVATAVQILLHPQGLGLSRRRITVSTAGLVPAMEEFVHRVPVKLAVSLNATTDAVRDRVMPINRRFPLQELLRCCRGLPFQHADRLTFEYVLLGTLNDSDDDARRLVSLLGGIRAKVNLIPFNPFPGAPFRRPEQARVETFLEILASKGLSAFVRQSRGESLRGACGQLVTGSHPAEGKSV